MEPAFKSNFSCDIGFNRSIIVECKTGKTYIDFATVTIHDGVPCKVRNRSLRLPIHIWQSFTQELEEIESFFTQLCLSENINFKLHLGSQIYISMTGGVMCVDIRCHYTDSKGELKPGRPGIGFKLSEFQELLNITDDINAKLTEETNTPSGRDTPDVTLLIHKAANNSNNTNTAVNESNSRTILAKAVNESNSRPIPPKLTRQ